MNPASRTDIFPFPYVQCVTSQEVGLICSLLVLEGGMIRSPLRNACPATATVLPLSLFLTPSTLATDWHLSQTLKGREGLRILKPFDKRTSFNKSPSTVSGKIACMIDYRHSASISTQVRHRKQKLWTYLPTIDDRVVHRCFKVRIAGRFELLTMIADNVAEAPHRGGSDHRLGADELMVKVGWSSQEMCGSDWSRDANRTPWCACYGPRWPHGWAQSPDRNGICMWTWGGLWHVDDPHWQQRTARRRAWSFFQPIRWRQSNE